MHGRTDARTDEQDKNSIPPATLRWAEAQKRFSATPLLITQSSKLMMAKLCTHLYMPSPMKESIKLEILILI